MLEGKIVNLRPIEPGDAERRYRWFNDGEVTATLFSLRYPFSMAYEERFLSERPANDFANGLRLAIETKEGRHIGNINLFDARAEDRKAELGITIGEKDCWSQGYGADAVVTVVRFAFEEMSLLRVWLTTFEFNERAIACYRKAGFHEEARLRQDAFRHGRYWDVLEMGILRDEFEALHSAA
jgi:RimJ/RimL family protein N-acetyltransferase